MKAVKSSEGILNSEIYRKILEHIKLNGVKALLQFLEDINEVKREEIPNQRIFLAKDDIGEIINRNGIIMQLIGSFSKEGVYYPDILGRDFWMFLKSVGDNMDKIDIYIANALLLESLNVQKLRVVNNWTDSGVLYDREGTISLQGKAFIHRQFGRTFKSLNLFSDKKISFFNFDVGTSRAYNGCNYFTASSGFYPPVLTDERTSETYYCHFDGVPSLIIKSQNQLADNTSQPKIEAYIRDFGFDSSLLPHQEELNAVGESADLKKYIRGLIKK